MTDTDVSVNPIYGDMLIIVNDAMKKSGITLVSQFSVPFIHWPGKLHKSKIWVYLSPNKP